VIQTRKVDSQYIKEILLEHINLVKEDSSNNSCLLYFKNQLPAKYQSMSFNKWESGEGRADKQRQEVIDFWKDNLDKHCGLVLYGIAGSGKTHLAISIGKVWANKGNKVLLIEIDEFLTRLRSSSMFKSNDEYTEYEIIQKIKDHKLVILNDLGTNPNYTGKDFERLQSIIDIIWKHEILLVLTTNWHIKQLSIIGQPFMDRLYQFCKFIDFTEDSKVISYRFDSSINKDEIKKDNIIV